MIIRNGIRPPALVCDLPVESCGLKGHLDTSHGRRERALLTQLGTSSEFQKSRKAGASFHDLLRDAASPPAVGSDTKLDRGLQGEPRRCSSGAW